jgi:hypothetical protein
MLSDSGQHDLFNFNQVDFDFNIRFEQIFLSIVPSVIFIIASSWRAASQLRKPTMVKAPVFQFIKLVCEYISNARPLNMSNNAASGYYRCLSGSGANTPGSRIIVQIPGFGHVSGGVGSQTGGCLDHDHPQSCRSQQKSSTVYLAQHLSFVDTSAGCGPSMNFLPILRRYSGRHIQWRVLCCTCSEDSHPFAGGQKKISMADLG